MRTIEAPISSQTRLLALSNATKHDIAESQRRAQQHMHDLHALAKLNRADTVSEEQDGQELRNENDHNDGLDQKDAHDEDGDYEGTNKPGHNTTNGPKRSKRELELCTHFYRMAERRAQHELVRYEVMLRKRKDLEFKKWDCQERWKAFCKTRKH